MFKNLIVYRIINTQAIASIEQIEDALERSRFAPCGPTQMHSYGWIPPRELNGQYVENIGGELIIKLCTESKILPGSVVKQALKERLADIEKQTGRKPGKKIQKEIKEQVIQELLPVAFTKQATTTAWLDTKAGTLVIDSSSANKAETLVTCLIKSLDDLSFPIGLVHTNTSPSVAMSEWLSTQEAPADFTIDRECELKDGSTTKTKVKYSAHDLQIEEVIAHIQSGKQPTKLGMTWNSHVSFELTDALQLKKLAILDVVFESTRAKADKSEKADAFDADIAIFTGEVKPLLRDLFTALGGTQDLPAQAASGDEAGQHARADNDEAQSETLTALDA
jgi:recombination associated protein RdgC